MFTVNMKILFLEDFCKVVRKLCGVAYEPGRVNTAPGIKHYSKALKSRYTIPCDDLAMR
jgi:hypothetical protein